MRLANLPHYPPPQEALDNLHSRWHSISDSYGRIWLMLKLSKKADYGLIAVRHLAQQPLSTACSAKEIARAYGIPTELLAKILQKLAKNGLLVSQHGTNGGYALARPPKEISAFEVIRAIEGPLFITSCVTDKRECGQMTSCTV